MDKELALLNMQNNYSEMEHLIPSDGSSSPKINLDENDAFCQARKKLRRMMDNPKTNIESDTTTTVREDSGLKIKSEKWSKITKDKEQQAENEIYHYLYMSDKTIQNVVNNRFCSGGERQRQKEYDEQNRLFAEDINQIFDRQTRLFLMQRFNIRRASPDFTISKRNKQ